MTTNSDTTPQNSPTLAASPLTPLAERVMLLYLTGATVSAIARLVERDRTTVRKVLADPVVVTEMTALRRDRMAATLEGVAQNAERATRHIGAVLTDPNADPRLKMRAAEVALRVAQGIAVDSPDDTVAVLTENERAERLAHWVRTMQARAHNAQALPAGDRTHAIGP